MALIQSMELPSGVSLDSAYVRVSKIDGNKDSLDVQVMTYATQEAYEAGKIFVKVESFTFVPSVEDGSENFIRQAYLYLKTLDSFKDAVDA